MNQNSKMLEQINEKIAQAPDASYKIGIIIGGLLPFIALVLLAYLLYSYMSNKDKDKN